MEHHPIHYQRPLEDRIHSVEMLCTGVDGTNGFRSQIKEIKIDMEKQTSVLHTRVDKVEQKVEQVTAFQTKVLGALIVLGFVAEMLIAHLWK